MTCPNCNSEDVDSCRVDNCTACGWAQTTPVSEPGQKPFCTCPIDDQPRPCKIHDKPPAPEPVYQCPQCGPVDLEHKQKPKTTVEDEIKKMAAMVMDGDGRREWERKLHALVELARMETP